MTAVMELAASACPSVRVEPVRLEAGDRGQLVVTIDIPSGCHVQSHAPKEPFLIPTTLQLIETEGLTLGPVVYPPAHTERFDWSPLELDVYRGTVDLVLPVQVTTRASAGITTITGHLRYQACTETACLPPVEEPIEALVRIQSDPVAGTAGGIDLARLPYELAAHGPAAVADELAALIEVSESLGVTPLLVEIAADTGEADVVRQRAVGRILAELRRIGAVDLVP